MATPERRLEPAEPHLDHYHLADLTFHAGVKPHHCLSQYDASFHSLADVQYIRYNVAFCVNNYVWNIFYAE